MQRISILLLTSLFLVPSALADEKEEKEQPYRFRFSVGVGKIPIHNAEHLIALDPFSFARTPDPPSYWGYPVREGLRRYPVGAWTPARGWEYNLDIVRQSTFVQDEGKVINVAFELRVIGKHWIETSLAARTGTTITTETFRDYLRIDSVRWVPPHYRNQEVHAIKSLGYQHNEFQLDSYGLSFLYKYDISPWDLMTIAPSAGIRYWLARMTNSSRFRQYDWVDGSLGDSTEPIDRSHTSNASRYQGLIGVDLLIGGKMRQRGEPPIGFGMWIRRIVKPGTVILEDSYGIDLHGRIPDEYLYITAPLRGESWYAGAAVTFAF